MEDLDVIINFVLGTLKVRWAQGLVYAFCGKMFPLDKTFYSTQVPAEPCCIKQLGVLLPGGGTPIYNLYRYVPL